MSFDRRKRAGLYLDEDHVQSRTYDDPSDFDGHSNSKRNRSEYSSRVPFELKEYVKNVAESLASLESGSDQLEMDALGARCLDECKSHEATLCCDAECSRHMEIICRASAPTSVRFLGQLLMNKRKEIVATVSRPVGSRCLESLVYELRNQLLNNSNGEHENSICGVLAQLGELLVDEFDQLVASQYATFLFRAFGRVCRGLGKPEKGDRNTKKKEDNPEMARQLNVRLLSRPDFGSCFTAIMGRVLDWKSMHEYYHQESISCLVQEYIQLEALAGTETDRNGVTNLLNASLHEEYKQAVLDHWMKKQASRVWESIIQNCPKDELIDRLYRDCLVGNLVAFSMHPLANFPLQRFLGRCTGKELATDVVDELLPKFDEIWSAKRYGVIVAIAAACARNCVHQKDFKKMLGGILGCWRPKEGRSRMFNSVLAMSGDEATVEGKEGAQLSLGNVTPYGSALVQQLLQFRKPKMVVDGLMNWKANKLVELSCHAAGSHVVDAFFSSVTITDAQKSDLYLMLTGQKELLALACDKYGSRIVETLWRHADQKQRSSIAGALTINDKAMTVLGRSQYGRIIWSKYQLDKFKSSPKEWRKAMGPVAGVI